MELTRIRPKSRQYIQKYSPAGFTVSDVNFDGPILVFPSEVILWDVVSLECIEPKIFAPVLLRSSDIDLCLFGSGKAMQTALGPVRAAFREQSIGFEIMDTGAACRTFNVLLAENRSVVGALFPPQD